MDYELTAEERAGMHEGLRYYRTTNSHRWRAYDTLCVWVSNKLDEDAVVLAIARLKGRVFGDDQYMNTVCRQLAEVRYATAKSLALPITRTLQELEGGRFAMVPALDGVIALGTLAGGYDTVQLTTGNRWLHVEVVCTKPECVFAPAKVERCFPPRFVKAGPPERQRGCCCSERRSCATQAANKAGVPLSWDSANYTPTAELLAQGSYPRYQGFLWNMPPIGRDTPMPMQAPPTMHCMYIPEKEGKMQRERKPEMRAADNQFMRMRAHPRRAPPWITLRA
jgi:hypothetical protein